MALLVLLSACSPTPSPPPVNLYARDQYVAGMLALHKQDYAAAEAAARDALEESAELFEARILLAESLLKQGRGEDGATVLAEAEALAPQRPEPALLLGMLKEVNGDLPGAIDLYQRARGTYDTGQMPQEQVADYVTANYLARGRLAGFEALAKMQARFGESQQTGLLHRQISDDNREYFLERVKPDLKKD